MRRKELYPIGSLLNEFHAWQAQIIFKNCKGVRPMKSIINLLAACTLVLTMFGQPTSASAADTSHFRGRSVDATFFSTDSSGCISTGVNLVAGDLISDTPPNQASPRIVIVISQYDRCTNTQLLAASTNAPLSKKGFTDRRNFELSYIANNGERVR